MASKSEDSSKSKLHIPEVEWKAVIKRHIGHTFCNKYRNIALDILDLDVGFKSGLILDYCCVSSEKLDSFIQDLTGQNLIKNGRDLRIVVIITDNVIYNIKLMKSSMKLWNNFAFVNVSRSVKKPSIIDPCCPCLSETRKAYEDLISANPNSCIQLDIDPVKVNPSTLYGVIIGYPVVYWYDNADVDAQLLSMEPLHCIQVYRQKHLIYSFSVPSRVWNDLELVVGNWFEERQSVNTSLRYPPLRLEIETKCQPSVCL